MEILGYFLSRLMGISLGLVRAGGIHALKAEILVVQETILAALFIVVVAVIRSLLISLITKRFV